MNLEIPKTSPKLSWKLIKQRNCQSVHFWANKKLYQSFKLKAHKENFKVQELLRAFMIWFLQQPEVKE